MKRFNKEKIDNLVISSPLDEDEQTELIEAIRLKAQTQSNNFRYIFSLLFGIISILFSICFLRLIIFPNSLLFYEIELRAIISPLNFSLFYIFSFLNFAFCSSSFLKVIKTLKHYFNFYFTNIMINNFYNMYKGLVYSEYGLSYIMFFSSSILCILFFGLLYLHRLINPLAYCLSFINVFGLLILFYIIRDLDSLVLEAEDLKKLRYNFKSI